VAIKNRDMVLTNNGSTSCSLTLEANESAMITGLSLTSDASGAEDVSVTIDRRKILNFVAPDDWNLLRTVYDEQRMSVIELLSSWGLFPQIPVGSGQKIEVTGLSTTDYLELVYTMGDASEFSSTAPFGSNSDRYRLFQMISNSAAPSGSGDKPLDQSDLDSIFPAFPGAKVVPSNYRFELLAMGGCPVFNGSGAANNQATTYLKAIKDRRDIFDTDLRGLTYAASQTLTTSGTVYAAIGGRFQAGASGSPPRAVKLAEPIIFEEGTELNVSATIVQTAGTGLSAGDIKFLMVFDVIKT